MPFFVAGVTLGFLAVGAVCYGIYWFAHLNNEIADGLNQGIRGDK